MRLIKIHFLNSFIARDGLEKYLLFWNKQGIKGVTVKLMNHVESFVCIQWICRRDRRSRLACRESTMCETDASNIILKRYKGDERCAFSLDVRSFWDWFKNINNSVNCTSNISWRRILRPRESLTLLLVSESPRQLVTSRASISGSFSRASARPSRPISSRLVSLRHEIVPRVGSRRSIRSHCTCICAHIPHSCTAVGMSRSGKESTFRQPDAYW